MEIMILFLVMNKDLRHLLNYRNSHEEFEINRTIILHVKSNKNYVWKRHTGHTDILENRKVATFPKYTLTCLK